MSRLFCSLGFGKRNSGFLGNEASVYMEVANVMHYGACQKIT